MRTKPRSTLGVSNSFNGCQICRVKDHLAINCPKYAKPKCLKCGELHKTKNCGLKCNFCKGLRHIEECC
jgi:hypothetical protein